MLRENFLKFIAGEKTQLSLLPQFWGKREKTKDEKGQLLPLVGENTFEDSPGGMSSILQSMDAHPHLRLAGIAPHLGWEVANP